MVPHLRPGSIDRVGRKLQHAAGFERDLGNAKGTNVFFQVHDFFLFVQENQVNGKEHPDRVNAPRGNDPQSRAKPGPPLGLPEQADQPAHIAVRDERLRCHERLSRLVVHINRALLDQPWP